jgi:hypothetical protein
MEVDLIKKSGAQLATLKTSKEFVGEHVTNLGQNFNAI